MIPVHFEPTRYSVSRQAHSAGTGGFSTQPAVRSWFLEAQSEGEIAAPHEISPARVTPATIPAKRFTFPHSSLESPAARGKKLSQACATRAGKLPVTSGTDFSLCSG